jgi:tRNA (adenine22-N1)-methyltransferase
VVLSLRLKTLAGYYQQSKLIYDIGCDHGHLGLSFRETPGIEAIHLIDPSVGVIETLNNRIDSYITKSSFIKVLLQRGQDVVLDPCSKTIFIAGMGGKEIQEILKNLIMQVSDDDRIVISPHRNILELREYLSESTFNLVEETCLFEDGQYYQVMCLSTSKGLGKVHPYGVGIWQGKVGSDYKTHQLDTFTVHQDPRAKAYVAYLRLL